MSKPTKLSEFIEELQRILAERGDCDVVVPDPGCGCCSSGELLPAEAEVREYEDGSVQCIVD